MYKPVDKSKRVNNISVTFKRYKIKSLYFIFSRVKVFIKVTKLTTPYLDLEYFIRTNNILIILLLAISKIL